MHVRDSHEQRDPTSEHTRGLSRLNVDLSGLAYSSRKPMSCQAASGDGVKYGVQSHPTQWDRAGVFHLRVHTCFVAMKSLRRWGKKRKEIQSSVNFETRLSSPCILYREGLVTGHTGQRPSHTKEDMQPELKTHSTVITNKLHTSKT